MTTSQKQILKAISRFIHYYPAYKIEDVLKLDIRTFNFLLKETANLDRSFIRNLIVATQYPHLENNSDREKILEQLTEDGIPEYIKNDTMDKVAFNRLKSLYGRRI
jgi:hypothetical protein